MTLICMVRTLCFMQLFVLLSVCSVSVLCSQHLLITGVAGYIGSHAALYLLEKGYRVTGIDNLSRGNYGAVTYLQRYPLFAFYELDLGFQSKLCKVLRSIPKVDVVLHFAAVAYVGESVENPLLYYSNVTHNTAVLLTCMKRVGCNKIVYSSSCAVYGNPSRNPVDESTPVNPVNPYGRSKLFAENIVIDTAVSNERFKAIILRYFNVYGSDPLVRLGEFSKGPAQYARLSSACFDAALGLTPQVTIHGTRYNTQDGTCIRDYIHVHDLVTAHAIALLHVANPPPIYNVGTGLGTSVREFLMKCRNVTGVNFQVVETPDVAAGVYARIWANNSLITRKLNWRPVYNSVEEGLRHAWSWRKEHPNGYQ